MLSNTHSTWICPCCRDHGSEPFGFISGSGLSLLPSHLRYYEGHRSSRSDRSCHGVFHCTSAADYAEICMAYFKGGAVEVEPGGCWNIYLVSPYSIGAIEYFGAYQFETTTGKMVLANLPDHYHLQPHTGVSNSDSCLCSGCGGNIFHSADEPTPNPTARPMGSGR